MAAEMNFQENFKLLVIILLSLATFIQAYSVSQIGDIKIEKSDAKWICDMIECPSNTERCYVSKSNEEQPAVLKRVNICYGKDNKILSQKETSSPINPKLSISQYVNSYQNGGFTTSNNASGANFDEEAFNKEMEEKMKNLDSHLENMHKEIENKIESQMQQLEKAMSDMNSKLANIFS